MYYHHLAATGGMLFPNDIPNPVESNTITEVYRNELVPCMYTDITYMYSFMFILSNFRTFISLRRSVCLLVNQTTMLLT